MTDYVVERIIIRCWWSKSSPGRFAPDSISAPKSVGRSVCTVSSGTEWFEASAAAVRSLNVDEQRQSFLLLTSGPLSADFRRSRTTVCAFYSLTTFSPVLATKSNVEATFDIQATKINSRCVDRTGDNVVSVDARVTKSKLHEY